MSWYIASPSIQPERPRHLEILLFSAEGESLGEGAEAYVQALLAELDIDASPVQTQFSVFRTDYFSDFADLTDEEVDWEDVWQEVWKAEIELDVAPQMPLFLPDVFVESEAVEGSWASAKAEGTRRLMRCLVIADFEDDARAARACPDDPALAPFQHRYGVGPPSWSERRIMNNQLQLHFDLGRFSPPFYEQDADYARAVQACCRRAGGTVHYLDLDA